MLLKIHTYFWSYIRLVDYEYFVMTKPDDTRRQFISFVCVAASEEATCCGCMHSLKITTFLLHWLSTSTKQTSQSVLFIHLSWFLCDHIFTCCFFWSIINCNRSLCRGSESDDEKGDVPLYIYTELNVWSFASVKSLKRQVLHIETAAMCVFRFIKQ